MLGLTKLVRTYIDPDPDILFHNNPNIQTRLLTRTTRSPLLFVCLFVCLSLLLLLSQNDQAQDGSTTHSSALLWRRWVLTGARGSMMDLIKQVDPSRTGRIDYSNFVDTLKWQKSVEGHGGHHNLKTGLEATEAREQKMMVGRSLGPPKVSAGGHYGSGGSPQPGQVMPTLASPFGTSADESKQPSSPLPTPSYGKNAQPMVGPVGGYEGQHPTFGQAQRQGRLGNSPPAKNQQRPSTPKSAAPISSRPLWSSSPPSAGSRAMPNNAAFKVLKMAASPPPPPPPSPIYRY